MHFGHSDSVNILILPAGLRGDHTLASSPTHCPHLGLQNRLAATMRNASPRRTTSSIAEEAALSAERAAATGVLPDDGRATQVHRLTLEVEFLRHALEQAQSECGALEVRFSGRVGFPGGTHSSSLCANVPDHLAQH